MIEDIDSLGFVDRSPSSLAGYDADNIGVAVDEAVENAAKHVREQWVEERLLIDTQ